MDIACDCTTFSDSWTDEQDIPILDPSNVPPCAWNGTFGRDIFGLGTFGDCEYHIGVEIFLDYNGGSGLWELQLDIFIGDHEIFCAHCGFSIPGAGVILSKDGGGNGLSTFMCPPSSDSFDLTWIPVPCMTGHVSFTIT